MSPEDPENDARRKRRLWMLLALLVVFLCTVGIQVARFTGDAGAGEVLETPVTTVSEPKPGGSPGAGGAPAKNQDDPKSSGRASSNGGTGSDVSGSSGSTSSGSSGSPASSGRAPLRPSCRRRRATRSAAACPSPCGRERRPR